MGIIYEIANISQRGWACCGLASAQILLDYHGIKATQSEMAKELGITLAENANALQLKEVFQKRGFNLRGYHADSVLSIAGAITLYGPVIVQETKADNNHFCVAFGYDDEYFYIHDPKPYSERLKLTPQELSKYMYKKNEKEIIGGNYLFIEPVAQVHLPCVQQL